LRKNLWNDIIPHVIMNEKLTMPIQDALVEEYGDKIISRVLSFIPAKALDTPGITGPKDKPVKTTVQRLSDGSIEWTSVATVGNLTATREKITKIDGLSSLRHALRIQESEDQYSRIQYLEMCETPLDLASAVTIDFQDMKDTPIGKVGGTQLKAIDANFGLQA
jgi:hypothetical protein